MLKRKTKQRKAKESIICSRYGFQIEFQLLKNSKLPWYDKFTFLIISVQS